MVAAFSLPFASPCLSFTLIMTQAMQGYCDVLEHNPALAVQWMDYIIRHIHARPVRTVAIVALDSVTRMPLSDPQVLLPALLQAVSSFVWHLEDVPQQAILLRAIANVARRVTADPVLREGLRALLGPLLSTLQQQAQCPDAAVVARTLACLADIAEALQDTLLPAIYSEFLRPVLQATANLGVACAWAPEVAEPACLMLPPVLAFAARHSEELMQAALDVVADIYRRCRSPRCFEVLAAMLRARLPAGQCDPNTLCAIASLLQEGVAVIANADPDEDLCAASAMQWFGLLAQTLQMCPQVWAGLVLCGMVWYGMVWYGMAWHGMVWYGMAWHGMVWYGMVWYGMAWHGMVWYGMVWHGRIWY